MKNVFISLFVLISFFIFGQQDVRHPSLGTIHWFKDLTFDNKEFQYPSFLDSDEHYVYLIQSHHTFARDNKKQEDIMIYKIKKNGDLVEKKRIHFAGFDPNSKYYSIMYWHSIDDDINQIRFIIQTHNLNDDFVQQYACDFDKSSLSFTTHTFLRKVYIPQNTQNVYAMAKSALVYQHMSIYEEELFTKRKSFANNFEKVLKEETDKGTQLGSFEAQINYNSKSWMLFLTNEKNTDNSNIKIMFFSEEKKEQEYSLPNNVYYRRLSCHVLTDNFEYGEIKNNIVNVIGLYSKDNKKVSGYYIAKINLKDKTIKHDFYEFDKEIAQNFKFTVSSFSYIKLNDNEHILVLDEEYSTMDTYTWYYDMLVFKNDLKNQNNNATYVIKKQQQLTFSRPYSIINTNKAVYIYYLDNRKSDPKEGMMSQIREAIPKSACINVFVITENGRATTTKFFDYEDIELIFLEGIQQISSNEAIVFGSTKKTARNNVGIYTITKIDNNK